MKLSIGMIVKNEERYLRRCLEAIRPILEQVDSELIIVDTGSTDATVEIARDFTDQVFFFEWCNDFAAARNSALERAKGEWFMSLDADEVFEDVSELIEFFNSEEYKEFNSATYVIRNSNKEDLSTYSDFDALRLGAIEGDTLYTGRIHEIRPYYEPTKRLGSVAVHYGYISEGNRDFIAMKTQRNLDMLLSELEQEPKNCRLLLQIGQTYCLNSDFQAGLPYLEKGLQLAKAQNDDMLYPLYGDTARVYYVLKRYSDVIRITEEYFLNKKSKSEIDLQMYFLAGSCHAKEAHGPEAIFAFTRYLELYDQYQKKSSHTSDSTKYLVNFTDAYNWRIACLNLASSYLHEKDPVTAGSILDRIPLAEWPDKDTLRTRVNAEMDFLAAAGDDSRLRGLFDTIHEWAPPYTDLIFFALRSGFDIPYLASKINAYDFHQLLFSGATRHFPDLPVLACEILAGAKRDIPADSALWLSFLAMWGLTSHQLSEEQAISLFRDYVGVTDRFLNTAYREDFLTEEHAGLLPYPLRIGYYCSLAVKSLESGDRSRYVEYLKIVIRIYPGYKNIIEILLKELQKNLDASTARSDVLTELDQYAAIIKSNIVAFIGSGDAEQAAELLKAYEQICPADPEIKELKNMIKPGMLH